MIQMKATGEFILNSFEIEDAAKAIKKSDLSNVARISGGRHHVMGLIKGKMLIFLLKYLYKLKLNNI